MVKYWNKMYFFQWRGLFTHAPMPGAEHVAQCSLCTALLHRLAPGAGRARSRDQLSQDFPGYWKGYPTLEVKLWEVRPCSGIAFIMQQSWRWQGRPLSSSQLNELFLEAVRQPSGGWTDISSSWSLGWFNCSMIHIIGTINRGRCN